MRRGDRSGKNLKHCTTGGGGKILRSRRGLSYLTVGAKPQGGRKPDGNCEKRRVGQIDGDGARKEEPEGPSVLFTALHDGTVATLPRTGQGPERLGKGKEQKKSEGAHSRQKGRHRLVAAP